MAVWVAYLAPELIDEFRTNSLEFLDRRLRDLRARRRVLASLGSRWESPNTSNCSAL
jgi:hypothetical protein